MGTVQKLNQLHSEPNVTPYKLYVSGSEIRRVKAVKYLGLMADECLTWQHHNKYITKKINRGIGILKLVRHFLHRESLIIFYQTLIEPYSRYCSVVWGQCCETLKDQLQVLQNRAARTIARLKYEDADHEKLLIDFGWLNVRNLIAYDLGVFMFKAMNNIAPEGFTRMFTRQDEIYSHQTRSVGEGNVFVPRRNINKGQEGVSYAGAKLWNEIPLERAQSIDTFK